MCQVALYFVLKTLLSQLHIQINKNIVNLIFPTLLKEYIFIFFFKNAHDNYTCKYTFANSTILCIDFSRRQNYFHHEITTNLCKEIEKCQVNRGVLGVLRKLPFV